MFLLVSLLQKLHQQNVELRCRVEIHVYRRVTTQGQRVGYDFPKNVAAGTRASLQRHCRSKAARARSAARRCSSAIGFALMKIHIAGQQETASAAPVGVARDS